MKLYVDDIRPAPEGWLHSRTVTSAIKLLAQFGLQIDEISIDHDISYSVEVAGTQRPFPSPENFTAVALFISRLYLQSEQKPKVLIHSANPVGAEEIRRILIDFDPIVSPASQVNRLESEV